MILKHKKVINAPQHVFVGAVLTFKQWADFPPAGNSSLTGVLTQRCLEKEHRDSTSGEKD